MNFWDHVLNFLFPPNCFLTHTWECTNEPYHYDGRQWIVPTSISVTWNAHMPLGEHDDSRYRFQKMEIQGILVNSPKVVCTHTIDKIKNVPVHYEKCTDRNFNQDADIEG